MSHTIPPMTASRDVGSEKSRVEEFNSSLANGRLCTINRRSHTRGATNEDVPGVKGIGLLSLIGLHGPIGRHLSESLGWHYLSNATCLMRPQVFSTALLV